MALEVALGMMAFANQLGDVPFVFTLKPGWANSLGSYTKSDCSAAIAELPRSTELVDIEFRRPRIIRAGACAIGVYVTHPDPSGTTVVIETWDHLVDWIVGANNLNTAASSTGWVINTGSGIQVCFWEPEVIDRYHMCEVPTVYRIERPKPLTLATCLDIIYIPRAHTSSIGTVTTFSSRAHTSSIGTVTTFFSAVPSTATGLLASNVPESPIPGEDIIVNVCRFVPTWSGPGFTADGCFALVKKLDQAPIAAAGNEMFMKFPQIHANQFCTCAFYLTSPPKSGEGLVVDSRGMNFQKEAYRLLMTTVMPSGHGGFVDLPNGVQIVFYASAIDLRGICWLTSRVSLRACIDKMVAYNNLDSTATRSLARATSSVALTSRGTH
ncbi:hypothetical protein MMC17_004368 [Xylographa soralifera]|nr:hypothetical protein [Xylographa soralifera]